MVPFCFRGLLFLKKIFSSIHPPAPHLRADSVGQGHGRRKLHFVMTCGDETAARTRRKHRLVCLWCQPWSLPAPTFCAGDGGLKLTI